ncbi:hypothetical protein [Cohnella fermenti]|uniref:Uncharacterized protein n=1 Tax=Cohnella fermenti TaxID=2565925 RepID=A0A4S4C6Z2_9BACL|nr:hypothetical protein [Cohnella fermenti]THF83699.1 hypothetical protein E6C55_03130 [Cohnella fermenti]
MTTKQTSADGSYLFQVDILIRASSNGIAMEKLLHLLNEGELADYRIVSGVQLGETIRKELERTERPRPILTDSLDEKIRGYIQSNKLIRVNLNRGKGIKQSMPCRIVNFDPDQTLLTLYHVDEKRVYSIYLNEIDDFVE